MNNMEYVLDENCSTKIHHKVDKVSQSVLME